MKRDGEREGLMPVIRRVVATGVDCGDNARPVRHACDICRCGTVIG